MEQISHWIKAMKHWKWNSGVYIFVVLFCFFVRLKQKYIWSYYHFPSEDQNKKNIELNWQEIDNVGTGRSW